MCLTPTEGKEKSFGEKMKLVVQINKCNLNQSGGECVGNKSRDDKSIISRIQHM